jgi:hypothetical protein
MRFAMKHLYLFLPMLLLGLVLTTISCDSSMTEEGSLAEDQETVASKLGDKQDVCHKRDEQGYIRITIADAAYESHVAHGDWNIGDPVPNMPGYVFDETCTPALAVTCPCFGLGELQSPPEGWTFDLCDINSNFSAVYFDMGGGWDKAGSGYEYTATGQFGCNYFPIHTGFIVDGITEPEDAACRAIVEAYCP